MAWEVLKPKLIHVSALVILETEYNPDDAEFDHSLNKFETILIGGGMHVQRIFWVFLGLHINLKLALIADWSTQVDEEQDAVSFSSENNTLDGRTQVDEELDAVSFSSKNDTLADCSLDSDIADEELDNTMFDMYSAEVMLAESHWIKLVGLPQQLLPPLGFSSKVYCAGYTNVGDDKADENFFHPPPPTPFHSSSTAYCIKDWDLDNVTSFSIWVFVVPNNCPAWITSLPICAKCYLLAWLVAHLAICLDINGECIKMMYQEFLKFIEVLAAARSIEVQGIE